MGESTSLSKRELRFLSFGILFLAAANIVDLIFGKPFWIITRFIYLGYDDNVSTWYSSMLLAVASLIAYECWIYANNRKIQGGKSLLWLACLLIFMSADEVARFHEIFGGYAAKFFGLSSKGFAKHSAWVWIGGPVVITIFIGFMLLLKGVLSLVPRSMFYLAVGFSLIVLGGIFLESTTNFLNQQNLKWIWSIEVILEEVLEMIGTMFLAYALITWKTGIVDLYE